MNNYVRRSNYLQKECISTVFKENLENKNRIRDLVIPECLIIKKEIHLVRIKQNNLESNNLSLKVNEYNNMFYSREELNLKKGILIINRNKKKVIFDGEVRIFN